MLRAAAGAGGITAVAGVDGTRSSLSLTTLRRYFEILEALVALIVVHPWHRTIPRALLQAPKVYFSDTGLVKGDADVRFENAVAVMLSEQAHWMGDTQGATKACTTSAPLHCIRTKDGAEVDFCLGVEGAISHLVECKLAESTPHSALQRFAAQSADAEVVQLVPDARLLERRGSITVAPPGPG